LQDVSQIFSKNGDNGPVRAVASVIGQEGEQEGFFRFFQKKRPSESPFLTTSVRDFAFTAIQQFTVPGSCPNLNTIPLKTFGSLNLLSTPQAKDSTLTFSIDLQNISGWQSYSHGDSLSLTYISQQNLPITEKIKFVSLKDTVLTFDAFFPFDRFIMDGLTIAAVTDCNGPFATADDVALATLFGPGLIEVN
jgi:hypothetical protein